MVPLILSLILPLCSGHQFLSLSFTIAAFLLFSLVHPYLTLTVLILSFYYFCVPYFLGFHPIAATVDLHFHRTDFLSLFSHIVIILIYRYVRMDAESIGNGYDF